jgi:hypothetical protein
LSKKNKPFVICFPTPNLSEKQFLSDEHLKNWADSVKELAKIFKAGDK